MWDLYVAVTKRPWLSVGSPDIEFPPLPFSLRENHNKTQSACKDHWKSSEISPGEQTKAGKCYGDMRRVFLTAPLTPVVGTTSFR